MSRTSRIPARPSAAAACLALLATLATVAPPAAATPAAAPAPDAPPKTPTSVGTGGAVSSVDPYASRIGLRVLRRGGNATDAAVAMASALGVTEPYSAGIGGGGYFVHYDAAPAQVRTLDGRETAPAGIRRNAFIDPATGDPYPFTPDLVTSGVSVGMPGTPATWQRALRRWGTGLLGRALRPSVRLARRGLRGRRHVPAADRGQPGAVPGLPRHASALPAGGRPAVGSTFRNPDLGDTFSPGSAGSGRVARSTPARWPARSSARSRILRSPARPTSRCRRGR